MTEPAADGTRSISQPSSGFKWLLLCATVSTIFHVGLHMAEGIWAQPAFPKPKSSNLADEVYKQAMPSRDSAVENLHNRVVENVRGAAARGETRAWMVSPNCLTRVWERTADILEDEGFDVDYDSPFWSGYCRITIELPE